VRIAIAGASGFIGRALSHRLADRGHQVVALSRSAGHDIGDVVATSELVRGADVAFYLVHSMASGRGFRHRDRHLATAFGRAAARGGVGRIVYLGGLGAAPSSPHLASRHEVGVALGAAGVPVVELRAAVVFGTGGISFEMLRYLTERLPVMVCPRWVQTRIQPIALGDLLDYLERSVTVEPGVYEIGGAEVTTYKELIHRYARVRRLRRRRILDIPWLTPRLSSYWVDLVTPVDRAVSHALIESLVTEVIVTDPEPAQRAFGLKPMGVTDALRAALDEQAQAVTRTLLDRDRGLADGVYTVVVDLPLPPDRIHDVRRDLAAIGGRLSWYGAAPGWALRLLLGRLSGERLGRLRPQALVPGALVDWWRVADAQPGRLVLTAVGWVPGEAWLGYRMSGGRLRQVAAFRPRDATGLLYWKLLEPVHRVAFARMARRRIAARRALRPLSLAGGRAQNR
jgi:uncharacterized protein YbjT (DUF2867 family)